MFSLTLKSSPFGSAPGITVVLLCSLLPLQAVASLPQGACFDFTEETNRPGFTKVTPKTAYDPSLGYGYLAYGTKVVAPGGEMTNTSHLFAIDVPEGNHEVIVSFGGTKPTATTVKAESRRLMIENVATPAGISKEEKFTVNVRRPAIAGGAAVKLNKRELGPPVVPDWDGLLTLEFVGTNPEVASVRILPAKDSVTVYLLGDSTVTDQPKEPWSSWGQMLPRFFGPEVSVADHAESGRALYSFQGEGRLDKVLSTLRKGDYVFIQFGHNDQKDKSPGAGAFTTYTENLKHFIDAIRGKGGNPVLVTPMERRRWNGGEFHPTLADYAEAVRKVGEGEKVPVIDLNAMSIRLYKSFGSANSTKLFVHYPANTFPGQEKALQDDTHHNVFGGYELARCIVEGIRVSLPELAAKLRPDAGSFDPSKPDDAFNFKVPASPLTVTEKPAGS